MTKASDNAFPSLLITEGTVPASPASGKQRLYIDSTTHALKVVNSSGTASVVGGSGSGISTGTANPGSPATNDLFYRTDLSLLIYYTGARWLTVDLYRESFGPGNALPSGLSALSSPWGRLTVWHSTWDLWLDTLYATTYVATTNDGSNFWTVGLEKVIANDTATSIVTFNTSAHTVNNWTTRSTAIGALLTLSTFKHLHVILPSKTGTPGGITAAASLAYRLVIT